MHSVYDPSLKATNMLADSGHVSGIIHLDGYIAKWMGWGTKGAMQRSPISVTSPTDRKG